ncbi:MAG: hypothetical protein LAT62_01260 [Natronospirillum sp.]|uniref:hypothetical protein n=1 Tax=Natronospirillum sp. TaxID=2812955 RepID=UPI0025F8E5FF|nr:hypothetical protein [Natronospirillum sp.]MCH8550531.1 hypothetical protein [Natronospirillum sp.]
MKHLLIALLSLGLAAGASAAGQYGSNHSTSAMVGAYGPGIGGIFSYSIPLNVDGLARSGLGIVAEGQLGGGIGDDKFGMATMVGAKLVFVLNRTTDIYGGLGVGSELLPDTNIGAGGQVGLNLNLDGTRVFFEAGAHPGSNNYLGVGLRF